MDRVTYTRESLAATVGVSVRQIRRWINDGSLSPSHPCHGVCEGRGYYSEQHVREARALLKIKDQNVILRDLGRYLRETGQTVLTYRGT